MEGRNRLGVALVQIGWSRNQKKVLKTAAFRSTDPGW
jgi:hypothetical protein